MRIDVLSPCPEERIEEERMRSWPVWSCDVSRFSWTYDACETCLLLEGDVTVTPELGQPVRFKAGDRVVFPAGMRCVWEVHAPVRKHYRFG